MHFFITGQKNVVALFMGKLHLSCIKNMKDSSRLPKCGACCLKSGYYSVNRQNKGHNEMM